MCRLSIKAGHTMVKAQKNKSCQTSGCSRAIRRQLQRSARDEECCGDGARRGRGCVRPSHQPSARLMTATTSPPFETYCSKHNCSCCCLASCVSRHFCHVSARNCILPSIHLHAACVLGRPMDAAMGVHTLGQSMLVVPSTVAGPTVAPATTAHAGCVSFRPSFFPP